MDAKGSQDFLPSFLWIFVSETIIETSSALARTSLTSFFFLFTPGEKSEIHIVVTKYVIALDSL